MSVCDNHPLERQNEVFVDKWASHHETVPEFVRQMIKIQF